LSLQDSNANLGGSRPALRPRLASNSLVAAGLLGATGALAIALLIALVPAVGGDADRALVWLGLCAIPVLLTKIYLSLLLQSDYHFKITNLSWLAGPLTTATVNGSLTLLGVLSVESAVAVWVAGQVIGLVPLLVGVGRHFGFGRPDLRLLAGSLRFGLKTHISRFLGEGNYRADQWFVGAVAGSRELGLYSVAFAWAELLFYLPGVIVLLQRPDLVRADPQEAARIAARVYRRALFLAAGAALTLIVAAPWLCVTVFGEEFRGSVVMLRVLAFGALGIVTHDLLCNALISQRRPLAAAIATGVTFAVTLTLDVILVAGLDGLGAAIAKSAAYTVGGLTAALVFRRAFGAPLSQLIPRWADLVWFGHRAHGVQQGARAVLRARRARP